nr:zinc ribbon domain-containing protein [Caldimonas sp.]
MTKLCSVCGTENREEAQFCRACGTAFSAQLPRAAGDGTAPNVCAECGFQNKPGLRYCANCGMSLAAGASNDSGGSAAAGGSPPPLNYPSFAPVAPYPPAPVHEPVPELPDPDAEIALRQQEAAEGDASGAMAFETPPSRGRAPIVIGAVALALVVAGTLAWTYMRRSDSSPPAIGVTTPLVAPTVPASTAPVIVEQAPTAAAPAPAASAVDAAPTAAAPADALPPAAARPLPQVGDAIPPESAEAEAKRVAAERRARAAREKAERDAKAAADQSAAAAQRAEQDAARKRADDAQRARAAAAPAPAAPAPAVAQVRGVRELCAGKGTIGEAVCQSRTCGQPEHANEPICRQLREQDERRRNFQN